MTKKTNPRSAPDYAYNFGKLRKRAGHIQISFSDELDTSQTEV